MFYVGTDPVVVNLVRSYAKPGGRLTGVHSLTTELDGKRLEILAARPVGRGAAVGPAGAQARGALDGLAHVADAMLPSQTKLIDDIAKAKRLLTIYNERSVVTEGGLAIYGVNSHAVGRQSAKYVHRVLLGTSPAEPPIERADRS